jgi:hypothetical protein
VINFKTNQALFRIQTPNGWNSKPHSFAISPGGNYLALSAGEQVVIYELNEGSLVAQFWITSGQGETTDAKGIIFSPDGSALSLLTKWAFNTIRILTWDLKTGNFESDLKREGYELINESHAHKCRPLQWLQDGSGWLVYDQALVDRTTGRIVWKLPFNHCQTWSDGSHTILDAEHVASLLTNQAVKFLKVEPLPRGK